MNQQMIQQNRYRLQYPKGNNNKWIRGAYLFLAMKFYRLLMLVRFVVVIYIMIHLLPRMNVSLFFNGRVEHFPHCSQLKHAKFPFHNATWASSLRALHLPKSACARDSPAGWSELSDQWRHLKLNLPLLELWFSWKLISYFQSKWLSRQETPNSVKTKCNVSVTTLCEHSLCDHSMGALFVWPLYGSSLCVTTLCGHSMCDHPMWALYVWPLYVSTLCVTTLCEHSMCDHSMWALYVRPLYESSLCVTTLCGHSMCDHPM